MKMRSSLYIFFKPLKNEKNPFFYKIYKNSISIYPKKPVQFLSSFSFLHIASHHWLGFIFIYLIKSFTKSNALFYFILLWLNYLNFFNSFRSFRSFLWIPRRLSLVKREEKIECWVLLD